MSATGAEDESVTVREEGTCGEDKVAKGKQLMEKSEFSENHARTYRLKIRASET